MKLPVNCEAPGQFCRHLGIAQLENLGSALRERLEACPASHPPPDSDGPPADV